MHAYVFPGQGAQTPGMGKELFDTNEKARQLFEQANELLGFRITDLMFDGSEDDLRQTKVTQPAIFLHSVVAALCQDEAFCPDAVAGHSLGEFSALVAAGALSFDDGLKLVHARALVMQEACELTPSSMAAIVALPDEQVDALCTQLRAEGIMVVPANYNSPGQIVISGNVDHINTACQRMKEAGARKALPLKVSGAFHSSFMQPAKDKLEAAIQDVKFSMPRCPIYQNVVAMPHTAPDEIKANLIAQLTSPVRWTQTVQRMLADGVEQFTECGPGNVLRGLIRRVNREIEVIEIQ